jgi:hypothetical protein
MSAVKAAIIIFCGIFVGIVGVGTGFASCTCAFGAIFA